MPISFYELEGLMFKKVKINENEISIINIYSSSYYNDLYKFLNEESLGVGDIDFNLTNEKFSELYNEDNLRSFILIKYNNQIILFSHGFKSKEDNKIYNIVAIHRNYITQKIVEIFDDAITKEIKKYDDDKIRINWYPPRKLGKCNRYFKKIGYSINFPWELEKKL